MLLEVCVDVQFNINLCAYHVDVCMLLFSHDLPHNMWQCAFRKLFASSCLKQKGTAHMCTSVNNLTHSPQDRVLLLSSRDTKSDLDPFLHINILKVFQNSAHLEIAYCYCSSEGLRFSVVVLAAFQFLINLHDNCLMLWLCLWFHHNVWTVKAIDLFNWFIYVN